MAVITVQSAQTRLTNYQGGAGTIWLAIYANGDVVTFDGNIIVAGSPNFNADLFFALVECTVDEDGVVTIPAFTLESTEDSSNPQVTLSTYLLDADMHLLREQPLLASFRVPASPISTDWQKLMENLSIPQIIIDPATTRTAGTHQAYSAAHGLEDSKARDTVTGVAVDGDLEVDSGVTAGGNIESAQTVVAQDGDITRDLDVGRDADIVRNAHVGGNLVVDGTVQCDGSQITNLPSDSLIGNTWTGTGALGINFGTTGAGGLSIAKDGTIYGWVNDDGTITWEKTIEGLFHDSGGMVIDVTTRGAVGDWIAGSGTDNKAAIDQCLADLESIGGGTLYFPPAIGDYGTTGSHEWKSAITFKGSALGYPLRPFGDVLQPKSSSVIRLIGDNVSLFTIDMRVLGCCLEKIALIANSNTGTVAIEGIGTAVDPGDAEASTRSGEYRFRDTYIYGFDKGISINPPDSSNWQCDDVMCVGLEFYNCNYAIYLNSQNCDNWNIWGGKMGIPTGKWGVYAPKTGQMSIIGVQGIGPAGANASAFVYLTSARANVLIQACAQENCDYFLDTAVGVGTFSPLKLSNNFIGAGVRLRHNCNITSDSNTYYDGLVTSEAGGDYYVNSTDDLNLSPVDSSVVTTSPFASMSGTVRLDIENRFNHQKAVNDTFSVMNPGAAVATKFGLGTTTPGVGVPGASTATVFEAAVSGDKFPCIGLKRSGSVTYTDRHWIWVLGSNGDYILQDVTAPANILIINSAGELLPPSDGGGKLGKVGARWGLIRGSVITAGDMMLSDRETGEELYKIHEDADNIFFDDARTGKRLMRLDREGNVYAKKFIEGE